jgi:hypothetical protein
MGGVWERKVRTIRHILWALCREQVMEEEGLPTLMCMVESIVNSRPITAVSDDVADLEALTPNHLLLLGVGSVLPIHNFVQQDVYCRRWRQIQFLTDQFWARWLKQYLPSLQIRSKWHGMQRNLAVGDVVLVRALDHFTSMKGRREGIGHWDASSQHMQRRLGAFS